MCAGGGDRTAASSPNAWQDVRLDRAGGVAVPRQLWRWNAGAPPASLTRLGRQAGDALRDEPCLMQGGEGTEKCEEAGGEF